MATSYDLTDLGDFNIANYNDYFTISLIQGIVKVPSILANSRLFGTFNMRQSLPNLTSKSIFRDWNLNEQGKGLGKINLEDSLRNNESFLTIEKLNKLV